MKCKVSDTDSRTRRFILDNPFRAILGAGAFGNLPFSLYCRENTGYPSTATGEFSICVSTLQSNSAWFTTRIETNFLVRYIICLAAAEI
jgi:hypothetical protein